MTADKMLCIFKKKEEEQTLALGNPDSVKKAAQLIGGKQVLAKVVGVSYKTILDWTSGRSGLTITNCLKIEKATNGRVTRREILPDYPWDALKEGA